MSSSTTPNALVSLKTVAAKYELRPDTLRLWLRAGQLRGYKIGKLWRVDPADVEQLVHEPAGSAP